MMNFLRKEYVLRSKSGVVATLCHRSPGYAGLILALVGFCLSASTQTTNNLAHTNAPATNHSSSAIGSHAMPSAPAPASTSSSNPEPSKPGESGFSIITERNIFNANRSGGKVQLSTRRATRIDSFTLVGTMAYNKGVFAFFEGSSSEFSKVIKANNVIAGHKLVDILSDRVKLEADGKQFELPIGSQMKREDGGAWTMAEASSSRSSYASSGSSSSYSSSRSSGSRYDRSSRDRDSRSRSSSSSTGDSGSKPATNPTPTVSPAEESDILKRLMERREKD